MEEMYRNKKNGIPDNVYRNTHHVLSAQQHACEELQALINRIDLQIKTTSEQVRNIEKSKSAVAKINTLKNYKSQIRDAYLQTSQATAEQWEQQRSEIQKLFDQVNKAVTGALG